MKKICLIGNCAFGTNIEDGQRCKIRLYYKILKEENYDVRIVDLFYLKKKPLYILKSLKSAIKWCDIIVLMTAYRGAKYLIPYINRINKKRHKRFVLPLIGTSVLHSTIDKMTPKQVLDFMNNDNYDLKKPSKSLVKNLQKIDLIMPETEKLSKVFRKYYGLSNIKTLTNFREDSCELAKKDKNKVVFASRVMREKGIFDLLNAFSKIKGWSLDIYGPIDLNKTDKNLFENLIKNKTNIKYCGVISNNNMIKTLSSYTLFVFPTRFVSEGTPGVLIESIIAGTPILSSNFMQSSEILTDGVDSVFFNMFDENDLYDKLIYLTNNENELTKLTLGVEKKKKTYLYSFNRLLFLECING